MLAVAIYGPLAQLGEHSPCKRDVASSNLARSTNSPVLPGNAGAFPVGRIRNLRWLRSGLAVAADDSGSVPHGIEVADTHSNESNGGRAGAVKANFCKPWRMENAAHLFAPTQTDHIAGAGCR